MSWWYTYDRCACQWLQPYVSQQQQQQKDFKDKKRKNGKTMEEGLSGDDETSTKDMRSNYGSEIDLNVFSLWYYIWVEVYVCESLYALHPWLAV